MYVNTSVECAQFSSSITKLTCGVSSLPATLLHVRSFPYHEVVKLYGFHWNVNQTFLLVVSSNKFSVLSDHLLTKCLDTAKTQSFITPFGTLFMQMTILTIKLCAMHLFMLLYFFYQVIACEIDPRLVAELQKRVQGT